MDLSRPETPLTVIEYFTATDKSPLFGMKVTVGLLQSSFTTIKGATRELKLSHNQYTRQLLWQGKLEGVKVQLPSYQQNFIHRPSIRRYRIEHLRSNKPKRYDLRIFPVNEQQVRDLLDSAEIPYTLDVAYKPTRVSSEPLVIRTEKGDG